MGLVQCSKKSVVYLSVIRINLASCIGIELSEKNISEPVTVSHKLIH